MNCSALAHGSDHNRATRYEVAVTIGGTTTVVGCTARKTKASLLAVAMDEARDMMLAALPSDDSSIPRYNAKTGWQLGPCRVHFTGGTAKNPVVS